MPNTKPQDVEFQLIQHLLQSIPDQQHFEVALHLSRQLATAHLRQLVTVMREVQNNHGTEVRQFTDAIATHVRALSHYIENPPVEATHSDVQPVHPRPTVEPDDELHPHKEIVLQ